MKRVLAFIHTESFGGLLLMATTVLALVASNSALAPAYDGFLHITIGIHFGDLELSKPLYHWVDDGLMAIFFLLIGLEVKREFLGGQLSSWQSIALPGFAALGGMLAPAGLYLLFNAADPVARNGWAIPTATDIAFALGVLSLLGSRVPASLKLFLLALAIIDDLGAIVIIALFYTSDLSTPSILSALGLLLALMAMNALGVTRKAAYFLVGAALWLSVLKSGVHATLAGVALAFTVPLAPGKKGGSPLKEIEQALHPWVTFLILPLFAFVNAGVSLSGISWAQMAAPVPLGIALGLFLGKQLGVFGFSLLAIRLRLARLPRHSSWLQLYGVSVLTGIGFTMSLFITSLAFESDDLFQYTDRLAILGGSFASGIIGYLLLRAGRPASRAT